MNRIVVVLHVIVFGACWNGITAVRTLLSWSNGIGYNQYHMITDAKKISKMFGAPVSYCFNPSAMVDDSDMVGYLNDLTQAGTQKLGRITMEVESLVK